LRRSTRAAVAYVGIAGLQRAGGVLTLPLFATVLTPGEYGHIAALTTTSALALTIFGFGLESVIYRFVHANPDTDNADDSRAIAALTTWLFFVPIFLTALLAVIVSVGARSVGMDSTNLAIVLFSAGVQTAATVAPMAILRAREQLRAFATLALVATGAQISTRVVLVVLLHQGIRGWVSADLIAAGIALVVGLRWQASLIRLHPDPSSLREGLRIGLPLVPHAASHWALNVSDRWVLMVFVSPAAAGLYAMGYQFGVVVALVLSELNRALMPRYAQANSISEVARYARGYVVVSTLIAALAAMLGPQIVFLVLPDEYAGSAQYVLWAVLGALFMGLYYVPMDLLILVLGNSDRIWVFTVSAAAANVGLNLLLVPRFGAIAAAVNTVIGYGLLLLLLIAHTRRRLPQARLNLRAVMPRVLGISVIAAPSAVAATAPGALGLGAAVLGSVACLGVAGFMTARPFRCCSPIHAYLPTSRRRTDSEGRAW
jgi:O-antigen/teichoic acid export membrane protein